VVGHAVVVASVMVPLRNADDVGKTTGLAIKGPKDRILGPHGKAELTDDQVAVADAFDCPAAALRLPETSDDAKEFGASSAELSCCRTMCWIFMCA
jgi:hypothetical protein